MAQWTKDEIKELLQERIKVEVERKKTYGDKISMTDISDVMADFVVALMADARRREVGRVVKWMGEQTVKETTMDQLWRRLNIVLTERQREMGVMSDALWNFAERKEKERPKKGYRR